MNSDKYSIRLTPSDPWHLARIDGWGYLTDCGVWYDYADLSDKLQSAERKPQCEKCKSESANRDSHMQKGA